MVDTIQVLSLKNTTIRIPFFHKKVDPKYLELTQFLSSEFSISTRKIELYVQAFEHKSVAITNIKGVKLSNERLEFLGDAVISSVVAEYIYLSYPQESEGFLTQMRARIVSRESLNRLGKRVNLTPYIHFKGGNGNKNTSIVGNAFESLIGAIYLDKGYDKTKDILVNKIFKKHIDLKVVESTNTDYKSQLLIQCQKKHQRLTFKELNKSKIEGEYFFTMGLYIDEVIKTKATAKSKRKAEQKASKELLSV